MTVYGSILSENPPLVTFGVAQIADNGDDIWRRLTQCFDVARDGQKPPEPWCGVVVHPALALDSAVMKWIGDFERHVAWAWITNASHIKAAIHGVVSLKHGSPARRTGARCLREKSIDQRTGTTGR